MSDFVYHPSFQAKNAEHAILHEPAPIKRADVRWYFTDDPDCKSRTASLLTPDQEKVLFLQYNYCRWRASRDGGAWGAKAHRYKEMLCEYNLALVISMVCRFTTVGSSEYDDLVCECNLSLLRSVELFDLRKGYKFSTYACHAICNMVFRRWKKQSRVLPTIPDPDLGSTPGLDTELLELKDVLHDAPLSDKERAVIQMRYLDDPPLFLEQIGERLNPPVSKERVRQIEAKALDKLKSEWYSDSTNDRW